MVQNVTSEYECHDQSDEPSTCPSPKCAKDEFLCANNRSCIRMGAYCDGQRDCADGYDETICTMTCSTMQFYCKQSRFCIPNSWVCDGDNDCDQGEDECNCSGPLYARLTYRTSAALHTLNEFQGSLFVTEPMIVFTPPTSNFVLLWTLVIHLLRTQLAHLTIAPATWGHLNASPFRRSKFRIFQLFFNVYEYIHFSYNLTYQVGM